MRYFYLRDEKNFPVVCVATHLVSGNPSAPQFVEYAVSTYNPLDEWSRTKARAIAAMRLRSPKARYGVLVSEQYPRSVKAEMLNQIVHNEQLPQRAREAAARWLIEKSRGYDWFRLDPRPLKIKGLERFETVIAKDQPQYRPLPAIVGGARSTIAPVLSRWTFSPEQREAVAKGADLWLTVLTYGASLQPILVNVSATGPDPNAIREEFKL